LTPVEQNGTMSSMTDTKRDYLKNKRVAITGGTGFIGSHLLAAILHQQPAAVRVISSGSKTDRIEQHLKSVELKIYKDAKNYVRLITQFKPDFLFILGGNSDPRLSVTNPQLDLEYNLLYNFELLQKLGASQSKTKVIYVSSVAVYGDGRSPLHEDLSSTAPKSPYGINKLAIEGYIRFFAQCQKLNAFSVRLSATYGPSLKKQVVYDFIQKLLKDPKQLAIMGDGSEIRDFTYVDDQVAGLLLLAEKAEYVGEIYNLGSGAGISVADLAEKIAGHMELRPKISFEKSKSENHHGKSWILDIQKASGLGHLPKTQLDDGLRQTIEWVKSQ
jgi:UDP-glucose 4-epimerase